MENLHFQDRVDFYITFFACLIVRIMAKGSTCEFHDVFSVSSKKWRLTASFFDGCLLPPCTQLVESISSPWLTVFGIRHWNHAPAALLIQRLMLNQHPILDFEKEGE